MTTLNIFTVAFLESVTTFFSRAMPCHWTKQKFFSIFVYFFQARNSMFSTPRTIIPEPSNGMLISTFIWPTNFQKAYAHVSPMQVFAIWDLHQMCLRKLLRYGCYVVFAMKMIVKKCYLWLVHLTYYWCKRNWIGFVEEDGFFRHFYQNVYKCLKYISQNV